MNDYTNPKELKFDNPGFYLYGLKTGPASICLDNLYAHVVDVDAPEYYDFVTEELPDLDVSGTILAVFQDSDFHSDKGQYLLFQFDKIPDKVFLLHNAGGIVFSLADISEFKDEGYDYKSAFASCGGLANISASSLRDSALWRLCKKLSLAKYKETL